MAVITIVVACWVSLSANQLKSNKWIVLNKSLKWLAQQTTWQVYTDVL